MSRPLSDPAAADSADPTTARRRGRIASRTLLIAVAAVAASLASWKHIPLRQAPVAALLTTLLLGSMSAEAGSLGKAEYRVAIAGAQFSGTAQIAAAFRVQAWQYWDAERLELAVGVLDDGDRIRPFLSVGPVWHWPMGQSRYFVEFGISPTLIAGSKFQHEDLGGNFHFTSALVFGAEIGRRGFVALRLQHTSNAGLRDTNPGMDMLGISFSFFGR